MQSKSWTIGAGETCDLRVQQPTVSGCHCRLTETPKGLLLEDLQSSNGTFVNGLRLGEPMIVSPKDTVTLGRSIPIPWPEEILKPRQPDSHPPPQPPASGPSGEAERPHFVPPPSPCDPEAETEAPIPPRAAPVAEPVRAAPRAERRHPVPYPPLRRPPPMAGRKCIRIGRADDNDVVLDFPTVSSHHAQITFAEGGAWLEDLGSTNGTAIGAPERKIRRERLRPDDVVYFGSARVPATRLLDGHMALGSQPHVALKSRDAAVLFGRNADCDHVLDDPRISRHHARLTRNGAAMRIEDLHSANGTYVNGQRIKGATALHAGDLIGIGRFTFRVAPDGRLEQRDYRGNLAIEAQGVTVDVRDRRLLEDVSLVVYPSEFVALMGPSGAGKTTLINALNGYTPPKAGQVFFNGQDLYANYGQFQGVIGYVPQDDIMHGDLTVSQALYYTARLRLPPDSSDAEIADRVRTVIEQLGLKGTEDVLIGSPQKKGISGGQRKRVNLAMELLTDPAVLFLDEPTSGLSSEDALTVMRLLRKLADGGKTILLTIHQPSLDAYRLLDNLVVVAKDPGTADAGRLVYYGPAYPQAVEFFNPQEKAAAKLVPDEVLRGLAKEKTEEWVRRYAASLWKRQFVDDRRNRQALPVAEGSVLQQANRDFGFRQCWTLIRRALNVKIKDLTNTTVLMVQAPIIALLIVLVFGSHAAEKTTAENWTAVAGAASTTIFLLALAALWFGCSNSAREIVGEWAIYHRERMVNLKIPSYVGSKFAVLGGLCVLQCAVLLGIVYHGAGLCGPWLPMFLTLLLTSLVGLAIGLTVSALARTSEVAIALLPLILLPMVILAGVLQPLHKMGRASAACAQIMPSRWAFESLLVLEADQRPTCTPPAMPVSPVPPGAKSAPGKPAAAEQPKEQDMAEHFFPAETDRMGIGAGNIALGAMLAMLIVAIHIILRARDVL